jgi:hypothetical protein
VPAPRGVHPQATAPCRHAPQARRTGRRRHVPAAWPRNNVLPDGLVAGRHAGKVAGLTALTNTQSRWDRLAGWRSVTGLSRCLSLAKPLPACHRAPRMTVSTFTLVRARVEMRSDSRGTLRPPVRKHVHGDSRLRITGRLAICPGREVQDTSSRPRPSVRRRPPPFSEAAARLPDMALRGARESRQRSFKETLE